MDFSWSELLVVGIVALVVIGPKDLPGMFRELGRFTAKLRSMGREFSRAMEDAAKESGVKDVADDLRKVANPKAMGLDAVKSAADRFEKWDPLKNAAKPSTPTITPPPMPPITPAAATPAAVAAVPSEGPNTAALREAQATKRATAAEARKAKAEAASDAAPAAKPKAAPKPKATAAPDEAAKKPGRVRKTAAKPDSETA